MQTIEIDGGLILERRWGLLVETLVETLAQSGTPPSEITPRMRFYEPPKRVGPLTIVAERDLVLTLEGPDRERFAFDVSQAEWVEPSV